MTHNKNFCHFNDVSDKKKQIKSANVSCLSWTITDSKTDQFMHIYHLGFSSLPFSIQEKYFFIQMFDITCAVEDTLVKLIDAIMHPGWILLIQSFIKWNYLSLFCRLTAYLLIQQELMGMRSEGWKIIHSSIIHLDPDLCFFTLFFFFLVTTMYNPS